MNNKRLLYLLSKFQDSGCSEEELQELEQWYTQLNTGNQSISDSQAAAFSAEMLAQFRSSLQNRSKVVPFYRKSFFRIVAASAIFVLSTVAFMMYSYTGKQDALATNNTTQQLDIASPKISKATITLANGNKISEKQFRRITNKAYRNSFKKMSIAEKKILFEGVDIKFIYQNSIKIDSTK